MDFLKTGDPCPCCGKPITWKSERVLQLLTYAAAGMLTEAGLRELEAEMRKERALEGGAEW